MKRSAAILGPTPPFLRWTIAQGCPYRDISSGDLNHAAFRELRSLRAAALGEIEGRVFAGVCLYPHSDPVEPAAALGFPIAEVWAAYGGRERASQNCQACPANVPLSAGELSASPADQQDPPQSKAGCFGWVPFGKDCPGCADFMRLMEGDDSASSLASIVAQFETSFERQRNTTPQLTRAFRQTTPAWYGVWSRATISGEALPLLHQVCAQVDCQSIAWRRLVTALKLCHQHQRNLHVDLLPAGHSDGVWWTTQSSCATCGVSRPEHPCGVCGSSAAAQRGQKKKVLGLRPYLNLASIVGLAETHRLLRLARS